MHSRWLPYSLAHSSSSGAWVCCLDMQGVPTTKTKKSCCEAWGNVKACQRESRAICQHKWHKEIQPKPRKCLLGSLVRGPLCLFSTGQRQWHDPRIGSTPSSSMSDHPCRERPVNHGLQYPNEASDYSSAGTNRKCLLAPCQSQSCQIQFCGHCDCYKRCGFHDWFSVFLFTSECKLSWHCTSEKKTYQNWSPTGNMYDKCVLKNARPQKPSLIVDKNMKPWFRVSNTSHTPLPTPPGKRFSCIKRATSRAAQLRFWANNGGLRRRYIKSYSQLCPAKWLQVAESCKQKMPLL